MNQMPPRDHISEPTFHSAADTVHINPLDALRTLRSASGALCTQASLYGQLVQVEWKEEKCRLMSMTVMGLAGFALLLCLMLSVGALVLALSWETAYRIPAIGTLMVLYGLGLAIVWRRIQVLSALGEFSFAATRQELATDINLLKSKL